MLPGSLHGDPFCQIFMSVSLPSCPSCSEAEKRIEVYSNSEKGCGDEFYIKPAPAPTPTPTPDPTPTPTPTPDPKPADPTPVTPTKLDSTATAAPEPSYAKNLSIGAMLVYL